MPSKCIHLCVLKMTLNIKVQTVNVETVLGNYAASGCHDNKGLLCLGSLWNAKYKCVTEACRLKSFMWCSLRNQKNEKIKYIRPILWNPLHFQNIAHCVSTEPLKPTVVYFFFHKLQIIWPWISSVQFQLKFICSPDCSCIKSSTNKQYLLLFLAFGLLLGWVWYRDVQWSLQGRQVIAVEWCLTGNTDLLLPTFSRTFTGVQEMDSCAAPLYVYYLQQHLQLFNLLREEFWDQILCLLITKWSE